MTVRGYRSGTLRLTGGPVRGASRCKYKELGALRHDLLEELGASGGIVHALRVTRRNGRPSRELQGTEPWPPKQTDPQRMPSYITRDGEVEIEDVRPDCSAAVPSDERGEILGRGFQYCSRDGRHQSINIDRNVCCLWSDSREVSVSPVHSTAHHLPVGTVTYMISPATGCSIVSGLKSGAKLSRARCDIEPDVAPLHGRKIITATWQSVAKANHIEHVDKWADGPRRFSFPNLRDEKPHARCVTSRICPENPIGLIPGVKPRVIIDIISCFGDAPT